MTYDYLRIYLPLEAMMLRKDGIFPGEFHGLHEWSKNINAVSATTCLVAALLSVVEPRHPASSLRNLSETTSRHDL